MTKWPVLISGIGKCVVGKDDLVLYIGDFCDGGVGDLEELCKILNGRKVLIKGNHDEIGDEWCRCASRTL